MGVGLYSSDLIYGLVAGLSEHDSKPSGFINRKEFADYVSD
jgi:hypothetical protein